MLEDFLKKTETNVGYTVSLDSYLKLDDTNKDYFMYEIIYQSNLIEGIQTPYIETFSLEPGFERPLHPELTNHKEALAYVIKNYEKEITESDIKHIHKTLMESFLEDAGEYRKTKVWIGLKGCPYYTSVPKLMRNLETNISKLSSKDNLWNSHHEFETIHPFRDGNGRTGRLLLNWLSLKYNNEFTVVENAKKQTYYKTIQEFKETFKEEHPTVRFYKDFELSKKRNNSRLNEIILLIGEDGRLWD